MKTTPQLLFLRPSSSTFLSKPLPTHPLRFKTPAFTTNHHHRPHHQQQKQQTRHFVSNPLTNQAQSLSAARTLSYPARDLYKIIADIESYPTFLPYCTSSSITKWSSKDPSGTSWPQEAELRVGWAGYDETFRSKVFCVPGTVIEAVAGEARTTLPRSDIPHHGDGAQSDQIPGNDLFTSLLTRWTLREFPFKPPPPEATNPQEGREQSTSLPSRPQTEVNLVIEVRFANAMYAALSKAAAPKVAGIMIDAFEKRARDLLGEEQGGSEEEGMGSKGRGSRDSSLEGEIKGDGFSP